MTILYINKLSTSKRHNTTDTITHTRLINKQYYILHLLGEHFEVFDSSSLDNKQLTFSTLQIIY